MIPRDRVAAAAALTSAAAAAAAAAPVVAAALSRGCLPYARETDRQLTVDITSAFGVKAWAKHNAGWDV